MRSIRDPAARSEILERIRSVSPDHERRWGRMDRSQLLVHLADGVRLALGQKTMRPVRGILRFAPARWLLIHRLPWPEGRAKAPPGAFRTPATTWDEDRETLISLLERYVETPPEQLGRSHPLFGRMAPRDWDVLIYRHLDHHLRQFSVPAPGR